MASPVKPLAPPVMARGAHPGEAANRSGRDDMTILVGAHIAGGIVALLSGAVAVAARKGGRRHVLAGRWFVGAMLSLWVSATALHLVEGRPGSAFGDIFIAYFVVTSWVAARRRDGAAGRLEVAACGVVLAAGALIAWAGYTAVTPPTPVGRWPLFVLAGVCLLAGLLDVHAMLGPRLTYAQRISRHLWRMCAAFFIATGSFFIGQQDVMPAAVRGSPVLLAFGFAPLVLMLVWLARLRLAAGWPGLRPAAPPAP